jgi:hypothetical protein
VLDEVGGVADDTRHQHLARRQFRGLPDAPLMLVPHIGGLEGIGLRLHLEDQQRAATTRLRRLRPLVEIASLKIAFHLRTIINIHPPAFYIRGRTYCPGAPTVMILGMRWERNS